MFAVVDTAFAQRRKMLRSALAALAGSADAAVAAIEAAGVDPQARGEVIDIAAFARIAAALARGRRRAGRTWQGGAVTLTPVAPLPEHEVRVRAPGKVNLSLRVGPLEDDGYHPVSTVFQAVSVFEEVVATPSDDRTLTVSGPQSELVPTDDTNLALRAARLLAARAGIDDGVHLHLHKGVPVAGGMAGGSADAAAALLACDALWRTGMSRDDLLELAAELGSDVPFALSGHTAVGSGRGHLLTPALSRGEFHWAFAVQDRGLSTARVYAAFDELARRRRACPTPRTTCR